MAFDRPVTLVEGLVGFVIVSPAGPEILVHVPVSFAKVTGFPCNNMFGVKVQNVTFEAEAFVTSCVASGTIIVT